MAKRKKKPFDLDTSIAQIRALLAEDPTPESWRNLLVNLLEIPKDCPEEERETILGYVKNSLSQWPDEDRIPWFGWSPKKGKKKTNPFIELVGNWDAHPLFEQSNVENLAPDDKAIKAMKTVAKLSKWKKVGRENDGLWGIAIGSADEYCVFVDIREETLDCNCPSRKRPCKHTLGLLLLDAKGISIPKKKAPKGHKDDASSYDYYSTWE